MCQEKPDRSVKLYEGHIRWIMELETAEERLAAWETVCKIAFPEDEGKPYVPPAMPLDGKPMDRCDRVRRQTYNIFNGLIRFTSKEGNGRIKNPKRVLAGRQGAAVRYGRVGGKTATPEGEDPIEDATDIEAINSDISLPAQDSNSGDSTVCEEALSPNGAKVHLTKAEEAKVKEWDALIPNADALHNYIVKNFVYATRNTAIKPEFSEYAYHKLAKVDRWTSTRDRKPLRNILTAIHYIALDYIKQLGEVKRVEQEERRKDIEAEYKLQNAELQQVSRTELADKERKRRRQAEKATMEKILRGEL